MDEDQTPQQPTSRVGQVVGGRYHLLRRLGAGGFAVVYEAENSWTHRRVAIKLLNGLGPDEGVTQRFLQEARVASSLRHPNIVDVLDMGQDEADGTLFIVQELLDGGDLAALLAARGPLPVLEALDLLVPVMGALIAAHAGGVIHRDIKPANIFITRGPRGPVPKLIDFGISKVLDAEGLAQTRTGVLLGTPYYMSPEQVRGDRDIDGRTDVWSMGAMLHEILGGRRPFDAANQVGVMYQILERPAPRLDQGAGIASDVASLVEGALWRDRAARLPDMRSLLVLLLQCESVQTTEAGRLLATRHADSLPEGALHPLSGAEMEALRAGKESAARRALAMAATLSERPESDGISADAPRPRTGRTAGLALVVAAVAVAGTLLVVRSMGGPTATPATPAPAARPEAATTAAGGTSDPPRAAPASTLPLAIRSVVRSQLPHVEGCYTRALTRIPSLAGQTLRGVMVLTVSPKGVPTSLRIEGLEAATGMGDCVTARFRDLRFPTAEGADKPTVIRYPLIFGPR